MKNSFPISRILLLLAGVAIVLAVPAVVGNNEYIMVLVTTVVLFAVLATAWNIIGGMAGQLDLAAAGYLGLGAFTTGTLLLRWNITPWVGMFVGGLVAAGFAAVIGYPLFRFGVRDVWYALSSSALVEVLRVTFLLWTDVGGPIEKYLPAPALAIMRFNTYAPYYYILLVILVIALFLNIRIRNTKLGYQLLALGENEDAAQVLGVNARLCKLKALMIYAFLVGMTGAVWACLYGFIGQVFFDSNQSIEVAILGIVGGMGIVYGPFLASVLLVSGRELLRARLSGSTAGLYLAVYAVVLILIALYRPKGLAPMARDLAYKVKSYFVKDEHAIPADATSH